MLLRCKFDTVNDVVAKVLIEVADENDNAPLFESSVYRLKVVEDEAVGYELIKVNAIGGDRDESVQYQLDAPDGLDKYFMLDSETGSLKLAQPLDYELAQHLTVSIIATDSGSPPLSSRCSVEIEILDVNDNAPHFTQSIYKATIPENSTVGTKVVQVILRSCAECASLFSDWVLRMKISYSLEFFQM
ncbi:unnamed protein product [Anisakis simplex]|uniref:CA domain-containing protein n=1 Tax=Anisakis simplex TaxID=6269 RepID=A0A0M3JEL0_ANISI|nr:unnamed protein product [Anisakis simplex]